MRISDDRTQESLGVERQEADCRALVERRGWTVGQVFRENDTSAYKRRKVALPDGTTALRVVRPAFRQLLDAITSGQVTALVAYDLDRVARDPRDLEDLIDAVEQAGIPTVVVTGEVDLSTDNGVFMARMLVNVANKSSRDTSRRVRRALLGLAGTGGPTGGKRPYGYQSDRVTPDEREATNVRWAFEQALTGEPLESIGRELRRRDPVRTWNAHGVRRLLVNPRVAGLRVHRGEVVGPASWPALVPRDLWDEVQAHLAGRPTTAGGGAGKHLLRGLLMCSRCSTDARLVPLRTRGTIARHRYGCPSPAYGGCGGMSVLGVPAEEHVVALVLRRLATLDLAAPEPGDPTADLRRQLARVEARVAGLAAAFAADDDADPAVLRDATTPLRQRADLLRRQVAEVARAERRVLDPSRTARDWQDGTYPEASKRADILDLIDHVMVGPHPGGPRFAPSRLRVVWR